MDDPISSIYGNAPNYSVLPATTLNSQATGPEDWARVLANGISGAAVRAINGLVAGAEGQLAAVNAPAIQQPAAAPQDKTSELLLIGLVAFLLLT